MAGKELMTNVTMSETIMGRTVFEISSQTDNVYAKVSIDPNTVLPLQPVHYHYIDTTAKQPRRFAVLGEYSLTGKNITLIE